ncbi:MAG TPA: LamG domain-containing protein, partial [Puia sp.]|nr:LamG domain-containing protein [Puia sp.]
MRKNFTFLATSACLFLSLPLLAQQPQAFKFTGTNYIVGQDPIDASGEFTVEFWAFVQGGDGSAHQLIAEGQPGTTFYVGYDGSGIIDIGDTWGATGIPMPFDTWTHFAVTFDQNTFITSLYLNGVLQIASTNFFGFEDGNPLTIGTSADLTALPFTGAIQNVAVYSLPRSAAQIKTDMFNTNLGDATLTMFYSMNDPDGTTITNTSLTGNSE